MTWRPATSAILATTEVIENTETWFLVRGRQAVSLQFRSRVDGVRQVSLRSRAFPDERFRAQKLEDRSISDLKHAE